MEYLTSLFIVFLFSVIAIQCRKKARAKSIVQANEQQNGTVDRSKSQPVVKEIKAPLVEQTTRISIQGPPDESTINPLSVERNNTNKAQLEPTQSEDIKSVVCNQQDSLEKKEAKSKRHRTGKTKTESIRITNIIVKLNSDSKTKTKSAIENNKNKDEEQSRSKSNFNVMKTCEKKDADKYENKKSGSEDNYSEQQSRTKKDENEESNSKEQTSNSDQTDGKDMSFGGTVTHSQAPTDSVASKKQRVYDDFSTPTKVRQNRLIASGRTLFINLGYLAEYSTYFANSYENADDPIYLDKPYEDVLELMRCMFFCPQRKPITQANINTIVELATYFDMEPVLKRCEDIISNQAGSFSPNRLFQLTKTFSQHQRNSMSMSVLVDRMARMDDTQLSTLPFNNIRGDVVADLYAVKLRQSTDVKKDQRDNNSFLRRFCCCLSNSGDKNENH